MALLPQGRWLDIAVEVSDVIPSGVPNMFTIFQESFRRRYIRVYSFANPPVVQTLSDFISTTRYTPQTTNFGVGTAYEYQDFSTDRYPSGDHPFGVIYMMFTKTSSGSPTWTQHINRLILNNNGVVTDSDEFDFPASSRYHILAVDQDVLYVIDRDGDQAHVQAYELPTSGANLVRNTAKDYTHSQDIFGYEVTNGIRGIVQETTSALFGTRLFDIQWGADRVFRQLHGVQALTDDRALVAPVFFNDALQGSETMVIQTQARQGGGIVYLEEFSKTGDVIRTLGTATQADDISFVTATMIARSSSVDLYQFKLKSDGVEVVGRTVVEDASGNITDIIPQQQVLTATVLGLPRDLQALNEWSFDHDDLTYTMESISSTPNPAVHELTFTFAPTTN